ncbi:uncharacterized protein LOC132260208 [Phlebotomus argentipes]|uniref:uncharacterized protein LOC132260208 n=1 Tax=Phlebotomus argentipes TaxID=94469 RepID=UPI002892A2A1|nr:uncharacterized protein LOC132260208 [Phlebotomus argentipes]
MEEQGGMIFMHVPRSSARNVRPRSPSPGQERNLNILHDINRRFCVRFSNEDLGYNGEEDSRSSSTDSSSGVNRHSTDSDEGASNLELLCSGSETSGDSTVTNKSPKFRIHRRSMSSIRRALKSLSLSSRSLSCSNTADPNGPALPRKSVKKLSISLTPKSGEKSPPPKKILRQPVSYTYLKGMSGLPTQRVPRSTVCSHYAHR